MRRRGMRCRTKVRTITIRVLTTAMNFNIAGRPVRLRVAPRLRRQVRASLSFSEACRLECAANRVASLARLASGGLSEPFIVRPFSGTTTRGEPPPWQWTKDSRRISAAIRSQLRPPLQGASSFRLATINSPTLWLPPLRNKPFTRKSRQRRCQVSCPRTSCPGSRGSRPCWGAPSVHTSMSLVREINMDC